EALIYGPMPMAKMDIRRSAPPPKASISCRMPPPPFFSMFWITLWSIPGTGICAPTAKTAIIPRTKEMRLRSSGMDQARIIASIMGFLLAFARGEHFDGAARRFELLGSRLAELLGMNGQVFR